MVLCCVLFCSVLLQIERDGWAKIALRRVHRFTLKEHCTTLAQQIPHGWLEEEKHCQIHSRLESRTPNLYGSDKNGFSTCKLLSNMCLFYELTQVTLAQWRRREAWGQLESSVKKISNIFSSGILKWLWLLVRKFHIVQWAVKPDLCCLFTLSH